MDRFATRTMAVAAVIGGLSGAANGQTGDTGARTPADLAQAIAHAIDANTLKTPGTAIAFESASSRDNVVELRYRANDAAAFSRLRDNADRMRVDKAAYYCNAGRIAALKQGVVMHEVVATADNREQLEFTVDKSSCDRLPSPVPADAKTLADFAVTTAKAENETAAQRATAAFRLNGATAHEGIVDERFMVLDPAAGARTRQNSGQIAAVLKGYYCSKYRDYISRGLVFHHAFVLPDESPVFDFTIGKTDC